MQQRAPTHAAAAPKDNEQNAARLYRSTSSASQLGQNARRRRCGWVMCVLALGLAMLGGGIEALRVPWLVHAPTASQLPVRRKASIAQESNSDNSMHGGRSSNVDSIPAMSEDGSVVVRPPVPSPPVAAVHAVHGAHAARMLIQSGSPAPSSK